MKAQAVNGVVSSVGVLPSYEIVASAADFFVSINGPVMPSDCFGYSFNDDECLVLHQAEVENDAVFYPVPGECRELFVSADRILFAKFEGGVPVDAAILANVILG